MKSKKKIAIHSDIKNLRKVSADVLKYARLHTTDESILFDVRLCLEEALRNAIVHGNLSDKKKLVNIAYWMDKDGINIEIEDEGRGFDPKNLPDPTAGENILKNSGRGVYLIGHLMDRVEYNEIGNRIKMVKRLE